MLSRARRSAAKLLTKAGREGSRPILILRKWIGWVAGVDETGTADGQKAFHLLDRFGDYAVRLAGLKLALELNEGVIGPVKPPCQHGRKIKDCHRVSREKAGCIGYVELRSFQGTHLGRVRLIQQNGQFTKY